MTFICKSYSSGTSMKLSLHYAAVTFWRVCLLCVLKT